MPSINNANEIRTPMKTNHFSPVKNKAELDTLLSGFYVAQKQYFICVPVVTEKTKEVYGNTFYQGQTTTHEFKPVNGKAVTLRVEDYELDCFAHKIKGSKYWQVMESMSGFSLGPALATTQAEAIAFSQKRVTNIVQQKGIAYFYNGIISSLNKSGLSPRYEYDPTKPSVPKKPTKTPAQRTLKPTTDLNGRLLKLYRELAVTARPYVPAKLWGNEGIAAQLGKRGKTGLAEFHGSQLVEEMGTAEPDRQRLVASRDRLANELGITGADNQFVVSLASAKIDAKRYEWMIKASDTQSEFVAQFPLEDIFLKEYQFEKSLKERDYINNKTSELPQYQPSILRNAYYDALRLNDQKTADALLKKFPSLLTALSVDHQQNVDRRVESINRARQTVNFSKKGTLGRFSGKPSASTHRVKAPSRDELLRDDTNKYLLPNLSTQYRYMTHLTPDTADHLIIYQTPVVINGQKAAFAAVKRLRNDNETVRYFTRSGEFITTESRIWGKDQIWLSQVLYSDTNRTSYAKSLLKKLQGGRVKRRSTKERIKPTVSKPQPIIPTVKVGKVPANITVEWTMSTDWDKKFKTKMPIKGISFPAEIPVGWEFMRVAEKLAQEIQSQFMRENNLRTNDIGRRVPEMFAIREALTRQVIGTKENDLPAPKFQKGDRVHHKFHDDWPAIIQIGESPNWLSEYNEYGYTIYVDGEEPTVLEHTMVLVTANKSGLQLQPKARTLINKLISL